MKMLKNKTITLRIAGEIKQFFKVREISFQKFFDDALYEKLKISYLLNIDDKNDVKNIVPKKGS